MTAQMVKQAWYRLVIKLFVVMDVHAVKMKAQALLGKNVYLRVFQQLKDEEPVQAQQVNNIINGEIVGRKIKDGKGAAPSVGQSTDGAPRTDPKTCTHPLKMMTRRGNRSQKWWTCKACLTRWERYSIQEATPEDSNIKDNEIVLDGCHRGKKYQEVLKDPAYCCLLYTSPSPRD